MTTAQNMIDTAKERYLVGGSNEGRNTLAANYTAGGTTLAFTYATGGIVANSTIAIGLEVFYVLSVDSSQQTAMVLGAQRGSTAANHNIGDVVSVNPRYTDFAIFTALNEELNALDSPGFFQSKQTEITYSATKVGYDLPGITSLTDIIEVRYDDNQPFARTPMIPRSAWRLERNYLVGEDSSTYSLKILRGGYPGKNITVIYKTGFTAFTATTDNATVTGLPTSAFDIPPMGAALRLGLGREIRRNDLTAQGDTRRAEEVGPGAANASWNGLRAQYLKRIVDESTRLQQAYPLVMP